MPEELIIRHYAPILAGIKTENLFSCPLQDRFELLTKIRILNQMLVPKGYVCCPCAVF